MSEAIENSAGGAKGEKRSYVAFCAHLADHHILNARLVCQALAEGLLESFYVENSGRH